MELSKRIFDLETETAFAVLAKANKLISQGRELTCDNAEQEGS